MKMISTHFLFVLIFPFLFFGSTVEAKACPKILGAVADGQMKFVDCIVKFSSPANSCEKCIFQHKNMTERFDILVADANCSKILNENRLNIVYNMQKDLVGVWNKAFCDDCLDNNTISIETAKFKILTSNFTTCVNNHKTNEICGSCSLFYEELNDFYTKMDEKKKGQICFDTQDNMNRTRSLWSKDLNCCHREYSFTLFFIATSVFSVLPIIFYFGMYGYTKRMERNHEVLDAGLNNGHASTSTGVQSGVTSHIEERIDRTDNSSDEDDIDKLKKQQSGSSKQNSSHPETSERPSSSNEIKTLIDL